MKKAQVTIMEYLITYGWAILIIIIVVGVLWRLGIFEPIDNQYCADLSERMNATKYNQDIDGICTLYFCDTIESENYTAIKKCEIQDFEIVKNGI